MRTNIGRLAATFAALMLFALAPGAHAGDWSSQTSKKGGAGEQTYLKVELENVQITSYQLGTLDDGAAAYGASEEHPDPNVERE